MLKYYCLNKTGLTLEWFWSGVCCFCPLNYKNLRSQKSLVVQTLFGTKIALYWWVALSIFWTHIKKATLHCFCASMIFCQKTHSCQQLQKHRQNKTIPKDRGMSFVLFFPFWDEICFFSSTLPSKKHGSPVVEPHWQYILGVQFHWLKQTYCIKEQALSTAWHVHGQRAKSRLCWWITEFRFWSNSWVNVKFKLAAMQLWID